MTLEYWTRIQRSIDYIEDHLTTELALADVARQANFSPFHFYRIFHAFVGYSVKEYIRKRRLNNAARRLINSREHILDIALTYQYETAESFLRAFKRYYGTTPSDYRKQGKEIFTYDRLSLKDRHSRPPSLILNPKFLNIDEFIAVGLFTPLQDVNLDHIFSLWQRFRNELDRLPSPPSSRDYYGICGGDDIDGYTYMPAYRADRAANSPPRLNVKQIRKNFYMSCELHIHPLEIQGYWNYIFTTLLPSFNFEPADAECLELFHKMSAAQIQVKLCVPIVK